MMGKRFLLGCVMALLFLVALTACGGARIFKDSDFAIVQVGFGNGLQSQSQLQTQGVPTGPDGSTGIEQIKLRVFENVEGALTELFLGDDGLLSNQVPDLTNDILLEQTTTNGPSVTNLKLRKDTEYFFQALGYGPGNANVVMYADIADQDNQSSEMTTTNELIVNVSSAEFDGDLLNLVSLTIEEGNVPDDITIVLNPVSLIDSIGLASEFDLTNNTGTIAYNSVEDIYVSAYSPGHGENDSTPLLAAFSDYVLEYEAVPSDALLVNSILGARVGFNCDSVIDPFELTITATNVNQVVNPDALNGTPWKLTTVSGADQSALQRNLIISALPACTFGATISIDITAPTLKNFGIGPSPFTASQALQTMAATSCESSTQTIVSNEVNFSGIVDDLGSSITRVEVYEGISLLGEAVLTTAQNPIGLTDAQIEWSFLWEGGDTDIAGPEGTKYDLSILVYDSSGQVARKEVQNVTFENGNIATSCAIDFDLQDIDLPNDIPNDLPTDTNTDSAPNNDGA